MINKRTILLPLILLSLVSCNSLTPDEYIAWLNAEENGLVKTKHMGGLNIKVKYLPARYLVFKDINTMELKADKPTVDSLTRFYTNGYHFLMTLTPEVNKGGDIMLSGITSLNDFSERVQLMNFEVSQFLELKGSDASIPPAICALENIYGLKSGRSINVVFVDEENLFESEEELVFVFNDRIFNTGTSRFSFSKEDIQNTPEIKF